MDKQAKEAREQMKQLSKKEKWTNFWYYYKTHFIVGIIVVFLIAFTAVECAKKIDYDLSLSYYSASPIYGDGVTKLTEELKNCTEDINYNGNVDVYIASCYANPEDASEQTQAVMIKLQTELAVGDSMGYIVDKTYYEMLKDTYSDCFEGFIPIGNIPEIREMLGISEDKELYWSVKCLYETEKDDEKKIAAHENALKVQQYFESLKNK